MQDLERKISQLSPQKREIILKKLKEKGLVAQQNYKLIEPREDQANYPLSFAQGRLWFLQQLNPDSAFYNMPALINIVGNLNYKALEQSINEVIHRHEVLRSNYLFNNEPKQIIKKDLELKIKKYEISELEGNNEDEKIELFSNKEGSKPFDLTKDTMLRASLISIDDNKNILIVTFHHIVADGWSLAVFINEIVLAYTSFSKNEEPNLPELRIQYADFAKWQKDKLENNEFKTQIDYWKKRLSNLTGNLNLPIDKPRPKAQTFNGLHKTFYIEKELFEKVKGFSKEQQTTVFVIMLSVYQALLYRYTLQEDIAVGSPIAYRDKPELQNLIGFFINTLVFRSDFSGSPSFTELVKKVHKTSIDAFDNKDVPFEKVVEALKIKRTQEQSPLFQTLFVMQNTPKNEIKLDGLSFEFKEIETNNVKFDLTLSIEESEQGLTGLLGYNTDLFNEDTVDEFIKRFKIFLNNVIENHSAALSKVELVSKKERKVLISEWSKTEPLNNLLPNLQSLFESQVLLRPEAIAIEYPTIENGGQIQTETLTYYELNEKANILAHHLINKNVKPDSIVALSINRSPEMIIVLLAILKSGAAYLPIDPNYPENRKKYMLEDSGAKILITENSSISSYDDYKGETIVISNILKNYFETDKLNLNIKVGHENLAYIIYTSGSTGNPKGVAVTHKSIVNYIMATSEQYGFTSNDRVLQFSSISFDAAAEEIYHTLYKGATLVLRPDAIISSPKIFLDFSEKYNITIWDMPTAYWHQLAQEIIDEDRNLPINLHSLLIGGERIEPEKAKLWLNKFGNKIKFFNTYGPTETTIVSLFYKITENDKTLLEYREVPIGKPVQGLTAYILDEDLNPIPKGFPGELCIGGVGLAKGYIHKPEITSKSFITNPFTQESSEKIYHTGDKVRLLNDGSFEYLGRNDDQVKVRGFRIELKEINNLLLKNNRVKESVVLAKKDKNGQNVLFAYFVPSDDKTLSNKELRDFLKERLPDYVIPSSFIKVDTIPLTTNGKIDIRALLSIDINETKDEINYKPPTNELEMIVAKMWSEVLDIQKIGIDENFFELGGDSLKAAVFINNLQKKLGEVVWVVSLFDNQTIELYSKYLISNYYNSLEKLLDEDSTFLQSISGRTDSNGQVWIDANKVEILRNQISEKSYLKKTTNSFTKKGDSKAAFILSAPRSGSTLLRVMLSGNPNLFVPPELALLLFEKLEDRKKAFEGREKGWSEGLTRAVIQIYNCDYIKAGLIIQEFENSGLTVQDFYYKLQELVGNKLLVDKTTTYASNPEVLLRAEEYFEDAKYIHITRHPSAMIQSYLSSKLNEVFGAGHNFNERENAELFWLINNQNVIRFLENIPNRRKYLLKYENLVSNPRKYMLEICDFLEIPFDEEMLDPYKDKYARMTDGIHPESHMVGDPRFREHKEIDSKLAKKWQVLPDNDYLSGITIKLSQELNYKISKTDIPDFKVVDKERDNLTTKNIISQIQRVDKKQELSLSFAQQRIWFLEQLEPGKPTYNIPGSVKIKGKVDVNKFHECINEIIKRHGSLRTIFPSEEGKVKQVILDNLQLELNFVDLTGIDENIREDEAYKLILNDALKPFDLANGPLIRWKLIQIYNDEYLLLICMHHIISDGWSVEILVKELAAIYTSVVNNSEVALPELPVEYVDYAYWQKEWMKSDLYKKQIDYWKDNLKNVPPLLELPTDFSRNPIQSQNGNRISFDIDNELFTALQKISKKENATMFVLLLTVFNVLLNKYSNSNDILIGTPSAGRIRSELENLIGLLVNTLVLRTNISASDSFTALLKQVRKTVVDAISNQEIPFEKLIDELNIKRSLSHSSLFQVMFVYNQSPLKDIKTERIIIEPLQLDLKTSKFDITLVLTQSNNYISGVFEYNTGLFSKETIERMISHFYYLLNLISEEPEKRISDIELVTGQEKQLLLNIWNKTENDFPGDKTLHELFNEQAIKHPDRVAVENNGNTISYENLDKLSNAVGNYLLEKGFNNDNIVGVYMYPSVETIAVILGVIKIGAAYLPLDPSYPGKRIEFMLNDSNTKIVFAQNGLKDKITNPDIEVITFDNYNEKFINVEKIKVTANPENLAYIIYTSGSTGMPKGVMLTHKGVVNHTYDIDARKPIRDGVCSLWTSLNFDASVYEIFYPLIFGNELHIVPQEIRASNNELFPWLIEHKVNSGYLPPFILDEFNNWLDKNSDNCFIKKLMVGVEPIKLSTLSGILDKVPEMLILNGYGPTETTICSTLYLIETKIFIDDITPIGRAMSNTRIFILDRNMNLSPIGVPGEVYIESVGEARGYLNRPDITAEKFVPNPFSAKSGRRIYRTGDLAFYQPDGNIKFVGRIDNQIKFKGFRIELGEIEENIKKHSAVNEAAVIFREDRPGIKRLVAYFTANNDTSIESSELRKYLNEILPDYMVPSPFVKLDKMPKTPNGKIDKKNLPEPIEDYLVLSNKFVEAESDTEKILLHIWKDVLKINKIGVLDNFFELGGDSILGIQVIAKANFAGLKLSPKNLFEAPTILGLANLAKQAKKVIAEQGMISGEFPLTPIQQWFFEKRFGNPNHWNQSILLEVSEKIDIGKFEQAVNETMKHHDVLRLRYKRNENEYRQFFSEMISNIPFAIEDLSASDNHAVLKLITEKANAYQRSLDIEKGPLFRIVYFKLNENENDRLLIVIHHLVIDGVSWGIILEDLQTVYDQLKSGIEVKLPLKTTSFKYWSEKLLSSANDQIWIDELSYWKKLKQLNEYAKIPVDFYNGKNMENTQGKIIVRIPAEKTAILIKETIQKFNTNVVEILLSAFNYSLSQWSGKRKHIIGIEGHGREDLFDDVDISRTIGWFTTTYPVLLDLKDSVSLLDSIKYIKEQFRTIPNNGIGFGVLKYLTKNENAKIIMNDIDEPDIMFNYLGIFNQKRNQKSRFKQAKEVKGDERSRDNIRSHLLDVTGNIANGELVLHINYSQNHYNSGTIEDLAKSFQNNVLNIIESSIIEGKVEISAVDFEDADITDDDLGDLLLELDE